MATVSGPELLLGSKPLSPAKLALTAPAYVPALMPLRLTPVSVATPLLVVAVPTVLPFSVKLIVFPLSRVVPDFSVAVSVAVLP